MSIAPDPDALRAQATRIETQAAHLRRVEQGLAPGAAAAWRGRAARRFEFELAVVRRGLGGTADQLQAAAAALRSHADTVEYELALIRRAAQAAADAVLGPVGSVSATVDLSTFLAGPEWSRTGAAVGPRAGSGNGR